MLLILIIIAIATTFIATQRYYTWKVRIDSDRSRDEFKRMWSEKEWELTNKFNNDLAEMERAGMNKAFEDEQNYREQINALKLEVDGLIKEGRKDAVKRSKQVVSGHVYEQISPLIPGFPYELRDVRHVGNPLDFIIFRGLSGSGEVEVIFLEIKTGMSTLNSNERRVKKAIESGRVKYEVFHPDLDHNIEAALEASIIPIRHEKASPAIYPGEMVVPQNVVEQISQEIQSPTETLKCGHCKKDFSRPIARGRKPIFCPNCRGTG